MQIYANVFIVSMVEKEEIDALEELKATQESLSKSFENELTALKGKYKALLIDYEAQKSQLIESLLTNNKIREALEKKTSTEAEVPIVDDEPKEVPPTPTQPDVSTPFPPSQTKNWRIFNTRYFVGSYPKRTKSARLSAQEIAQTSRIGNHFSSHIPIQSRMNPFFNPATIPLPDSRPTTARSEPYRSGGMHVGESMQKCISLTAVLAGRRSVEEGRYNRRTPGKDSNLHSLWSPAADTTLRRASSQASFVDIELDAARFAAETVAASRAQEALVRKAELQRRHRQRGSAIGRVLAKIRR